MVESVLVLHGLVAVPVTATQVLLRCTFCKDWPLIVTTPVMLTGRSFYDFTCKVKIMVWVSPAYSRMRKFVPYLAKKIKEGIVFISNQ